MVILPNRRKSFQSSGAVTPPTPATDPYFANVVLLLHADGDNGATSTTDSSTYNRTATFYGNAKLSTTTPKFGSAALDLDGAGDYITFPSSSNFTFDGNFTVETWAYFRQNKAEYQSIFGAGDYQFLFWFQELVMVLPGLGLVRPAAGNNISLNAWHHVVMCRYGSSLKLFVDGVQYGTTTAISASLTCNNVASIGYHTGSFGYLNAKLDDMRVTKGIARYTANFTPPTEAFPNSAPAGNDPYFASVVLLLHLDGANGDTSTTDSSAYNKSITFGGNAQLNTTLPKFETGAAVLLDGSGDYLEVADSGEWDFGTGDFTIEGWVKFAAASDASTFVSTYNSGNGFTFRFNDTSHCLEFLWGGTMIASTTAWTWVPTIGLWQHFTVCRSGTSIRMFIDGVQQGSTATDSTNMTGSTVALQIGCLPYGLPTRYHFLNGRLDDLRITKGVARYTASFTPPTAAFPNY